MIISLGTPGGHQRLLRWILRRSLLLVIALTASFTVGCFDNFNIGISGNVRNQDDSSHVEGALVLLGGRGVTTNSNGFYKFGGYSPEHETTAEVHLTVTDVDGEINGVFISRDSLVVLDGTQYIQDIDLTIDFYVEMVDNESGTNSACRGGV